MANVFIWPSLGVVCACGAVRYWAYRCTMDARVEETGFHVLTVSDIMVYFDHCKKVLLYRAPASPCMEVMVLTYLHVDDVWYRGEIGLTCMTQSITCRNIQDVD